MSPSHQKYYPLDNQIISLGDICVTQYTGLKYALLYKDNKFEFQQNRVIKLSIAVWYSKISTS